MIFLITFGKKAYRENNFIICTMQILKDTINISVPLIIASFARSFGLIPDSCYIASICNHTLVPVCGIEKKIYAKRLFPDACRLHGHNCRNGEEYVQIDLKECADFLNEIFGLTENSFADKQSYSAVVLSNTNGSSFKGLIHETNSTETLDSSIINKINASTLATNDKNITGTSDSIFYNWSTMSKTINTERHANRTSHLDAYKNLNITRRINKQEHPTDITNLITNDSFKMSVNIKGNDTETINPISNNELNLTTTTTTTEKAITALNYSSLFTFFSSPFSHVNRSIPVTSRTTVNQNKTIVSYSDKKSTDVLNATHSTSQNGTQNDTAIVMEPYSITMSTASNATITTKIVSQEQTNTTSITWIPNQSIKKSMNQVSSTISNIYINTDTATTIQVVSNATESWEPIQTPFSKFEDSNTTFTVTTPRLHVQNSEFNVTGSVSTTSVLESPISSTPEYIMTQTYSTSPCVTCPTILSSILIPSRQTIVVDYNLSTTMDYMTLITTPFATTANNSYLSASATSTPTTQNFIICKCFSSVTSDPTSKNIITTNPATTSFPTISNEVSEIKIPTISNSAIIKSNTAPPTCSVSISIGNVTNLEQHKLTMSLNTTTIINVTENKENQSVIPDMTCGNYSKNCEIPLQWDTTVKGETRDFFRFLRDRYDPEVKIMKDTTHFPKRTILLSNNKMPSFLDNMQS